MKSSFFSVFGLFTISCISATTLNGSHYRQNNIQLTAEENTLSRQSAAVQMRRLKSKVIFLPFRENQNEKINRIMRLMHLMELACFRKFAKPVHFKNRHQRPFKAVKPLKMGAVRNDGSFFDHQTFYQGNQNRLSPKYFGDRRIIYVPSLEKTTEKRESYAHNISRSNLRLVPPLDFQRTFSSQAVTGKNNLNEEIKNQNKKIIKITNFPRNNESLSQIKNQIENTSLNKENIKYIQLLPPEKHERVFENPKILKPETGKPIKFSHQTSVDEINSTTAANNSPHFFNQSKPNQVQQYEVEEILEERVSIDLKDNKDDHFQSLPFNGKTIEGETIKQSNDPVINDLISKSINSVLKTLINTMVENAPTTEEIKKNGKKKLFENSPTSLPPRFSRKFSNHRPENFLKNINDKFSIYSEEPTKPFKSTPRYKFQNNATEHSTKLTFPPVLKLNFTPTTTAKYNKYDYKTNAESTTEQHLHSTRITQETKINDLPTDLFENLHQETVPEIKTSTDFFKHTSPSHVNSTDLLKDLTIEQPNNQELSSSAPQDIQNRLLTSTTTNENLPTVLSSLEIPTTDSEEFEGFELNKTTPTDKPEKVGIFTEDTSTTPLEQNVLTSTKHSSEMTLNYQELTDKPVTSDWFTTVNPIITKDEVESTQMRFEQDPTENTAVDGVSENEEQRRSDILINENFNDYDVINNNLSLLNYLEKMKQNDSVSLTDHLLNSTTDSIIPLIPVVISELREDKISPDDLSILSKVFGKYWMTIMALANSTNLDMLPLLKINNEEDLKNVLQNFYQEYLETTTTTTTTTTENRKDNNYESYDYLEEYKNLYDDVLESENEKNEKKRKRYRLKRDEEDQLRHVKATQKNFQTVKGAKNQENNYIHEDILYGEISQDENSNVLELNLKTADVNVNTQNVTSQAENKVF